MHEKLEITQESLSKKISEKTGQIETLMKNYSELDKAHKDSENDFLNKQKELYDLIKSLQRERNGLGEEVDKLKKELNDKTQCIENLEQDLDYMNKSFAQAVTDKKALETSINDLEITMKQLDIYQTRQNLEELHMLRQKLQQEIEGKKEQQAVLDKIKRDYEDLQDKMVKDSQFFRAETSRKDQDFLKIKSFCTSKLKEKDAEFAIRNEEIRSELNAVMGEIISNNVSLECCDILEHIIQSLK